MRIHEAKATCDWTTDIPAVKTYAIFTAGTRHKMTAVHVSDGDGDKLFRIYDGLINPNDPGTTTLLIEYATRYEACSSKHKKIFDYLVSAADMVFAAM